MKKFIYTLIMLLATMVCKADQLAYITKAQAIQATEFLKTQEKLILWCACCDNETKELIHVADVYYKYTGYEDYYRVYMEGIDQSGEKKTYPLDLASVHYISGPKAHCVGVDLNFDCNPCTMPFYHEINIVRKMPKTEEINIAYLLGTGRFLGLLDDDMQPMDIKFSTIKRVAANKYELVGKSKVKKNLCDFQGVMEAQYVQESEFDQSDENNVNGKIVGRYRFEENKKQSGTGVFEGVFEIYWTYELNQYDDYVIVPAFLLRADSNYTLLFDGTWQSYRKGIIKKACWSDKNGCFYTNTITSQDVEKFCKDFINSIDAGEIKKSLTYFAPEYVKEEHDNFLQGRTNQFLTEFLAGNTSDGGFICPRNITDIKSIEIKSTSVNPNESEAAAIFEVQLNTGVTYAVGVRLSIDKANRLHMWGAMG